MYLGTACYILLRHHLCQLGWMSYKLSWASSGADCPLPDLKVDSWACTITHNTHSLCDSVLNLQVPGALHKWWGSLQTTTGNEVPTCPKRLLQARWQTKCSRDIFKYTGRRLVIERVIIQWRLVIVNYLTERIKVQIAGFAQLLLKWYKSILIVIRTHPLQCGY